MSNIREVLKDLQAKTVAIQQGDSYMQLVDEAELAINKIVLGEVRDELEKIYAMMADQTNEDAIGDTETYIQLKLAKTNTTQSNKEGS